MPWLRGNRLNLREKLLKSGHHGRITRWVTFLDEKKKRENMSQTVTLFLCYLENVPFININNIYAYLALTEVLKEM